MTDNNPDRQDDPAIHGMLREWRRGGTGDDDTFVRRVMRAIEAPSAARTSDAGRILRWPAWAQWPAAAAAVAVLAVGMGGLIWSLAQPSGPRPSTADSGWRPMNGPDVYLVSAALVPPPAAPSRALVPLDGYPTLCSSIAAAARRERKPAQTRDPAGTIQRPPAPAGPRLTRVKTRMMEVGS